MYSSKTGASHGKRCRCLSSSRRRTAFLRVLLTGRLVLVVRSVGSKPDEAGREDQLI